MPNLIEHLGPYGHPNAATWAQIRLAASLLRRWRPYAIAERLASEWGYVDPLARAHFVADHIERARSRR